MPSKTTAIKPFSDRKDLLIADCLRERARVLARMHRAEAQAEADPRDEVLELLRTTGGK